MSESAETRIPLFIEQALVDTTHRRVGHRHSESFGYGLRYPEYLGSLAVERVRFDPDYDASPIADGAKTDFTASYEADTPEMGRVVRQRSMAWLDWLSQNTNLNVPTFTYLDLATVAAEHGDAETVQQIVKDPRRLWLDKHVSTRVSDPAFGKLEQLTTDTISGRISAVAKLMAVAPKENAKRMRAAVMPTFRSVVTEFMSRDLISKGHSIERTAIELLTVGTPEAISHMDSLVRAIPMTAERLDLLVRLTEQDERFAAAAAEAIAWHNEKAALAQAALVQYMTPYGTARDIIEYPRNRSRREDPVASQPIAAAIVDQIPADTTGTSAIETSVAYVNDAMFGGSVQGHILKCLRTFTNNAHFELADPQFGFAATFENGERSYAHGLVTIVDRNLPKGRLTIDLSSEPFRDSIAHDETRFLCRIIQAEKNRRASVA